MHRYPERNRTPCTHLALQKNQDDDGFTLVELIIVCVLIGLMLSITIPTMRSSFFSDPLKTSSRKAVGFVAGVRELAVRQQQPFLLHISESENRLWYEEDNEPEDEGDNNEEKELKFPDDVSIKQVWIGGDGSSVEDKTVVWVSQQGYMNPTMIRLSGDDGEDLTLMFRPFIDTPIISEDFEVPLEK